MTSASAATSRAERTERRKREGLFERRDKTIFGVPERFMGPRLVLIAATVIMVGFGLLMVYSASSVTALTQKAYGFDPTYFLKRQALLAVVGTVAAIVLARVNYHVWCRSLLPVIWVATVLLLLLIMTPIAGSDAYGATRWIRIGGFTFQPSEFAKLTVIMTAANIAQRYFEDHSLDFNTFAGLMAGGCGVPLLLILLQPDKGTTIILCVTLVVMGYLAGVDKRFLGIASAFGVAAFLFLILKDSYSRARVMTMLDPWSDPYGDGYQIIQGFYAFGSGGLLGLGLGFSRQKYFYLPMAHNDFIFAVIGEELGLVGTLGVLIGFAVVLWAGLRIARYAPDLTGRLVASGCSVLLVVQLLVNVCGVLGIMPLTGKPIPFLSYGGSSIISSIMIVGLIVSVSRGSSLPSTEYDERRSSWRVSGDDTGEQPMLSLVGEPTRRSERSRRSEDSDAGRRSSRTFTVVDGGSRGSSSSSRGRIRTDSSGRSRIDLGPSASERLRGDSSRRPRRGE